MVLEAVMICLDNSEWMRNGDLTPTRLEAQNEAVSYICSGKMQSNQENTVGFLSMAGKRIQVHVTPCRDMGAILNPLSSAVNVGGVSNFVGGLKTARLALKNRQNKNQRQRIVLFVGSPIEHTTQELVKLGKVLKKNSVAVDVINFGAENAGNGNYEKLEAFIKAVNSSDNSNLVNIPPGPHILSDLIMTSAIMVDGSQPAPAAGGAGSFGAAAGGADGGDVDANMDPELAMALRMSMEEERERQQRAAKERGEGSGEGEAATEAAASVPMAIDEDDEDAMLAQAIALSMAAGEDGDVDMSQFGAAPVDEGKEDKPEEGAGEGEAEDLTEALQDPDFMNSLLDQLPGVDKNDMGDILNALTGEDQGKKDEDKKKEGEDKK